MRKLWKTAFQIYRATRHARFDSDGAHRTPMAAAHYVANIMAEKFSMHAEAALALGELCAGIHEKRFALVRAKSARLANKTAALYKRRLQNLLAR